MLLLSDRFEVRARCAYTLRLARDLGERGIEPVLACPNADRVAPDVRETLDVRVYPSLRFRRWLGPAAVEPLRRDLADKPFDLIHVQSVSMQAAGLWLARVWGVPVVTTVSVVPPGLRVAGLGGACRRVIAISRTIAGLIDDVKAVPADKVEVIVSGVDVAEEPPSPVFAAGRVPVLGTAGPLEMDKGVGYFLGAAAKLIEAGRDAEFLVAGSGPEERNLRRLARDLGLGGRTTFVPNLYDFAESFAAIDVFCLPSLSQGLGVTMLEAMAVGRPVVASRLGGVAEIVDDGVTGLIAEPADADDLAAKLGELLDHPARARALGDAGLARVRERFTAERMVDETAELYRDVLALNGDDTEDGT